MVDRNRIAISVIIPIYNAERHLEECLDSCSKQEGRDLEFVCYDDCSADGSVSVVERFSRTDCRFVLLRGNENRGTHMARKAAVLASRGRYLLFLDSDDLLMPDACRKLLSAVARGEPDFLLYG